MCLRVGRGLSSICVSPQSPQTVLKQLSWDLVHRLHIWMQQNVRREFLKFCWGAELQGPWGHTQHNFVDIFVRFDKKWSPTTTNKLIILGFETPRDSRGYTYLAIFNCNVRNTVLQNEHNQMCFVLFLWIDLSTKIFTRDQLCYQ